MGTSDIITLFLIAIVCTATIAYFVVKSYKKVSRINSIMKAHPSLVMALLNNEELPSFMELSKEQIEKILSFSDDDWDEWESLKDRVLNIAQQYPDTLFEFINEHFPENSERITYKKNVNLFTPIPQKVKYTLTSLSLEELRMIDADSEDIWKERDKLRLSLSKIKRKFPEGYETYCSIHKSSTLLYSVIISDKKQIIELQKLYEDSKGYEGWEKRQKEFCSKFWKILKDIRSQDGRYTYQVPYMKPTRTGTLVESEFKVWQGFCESFSSFLKNRQTDSFYKRYTEISLLKERRVHFYDNVYDEILEIIKKINEEIEGNVVVVFVDKCKREWSKLSYNYHYRHIREILNDTDIRRYNFSELPLINDDGHIGGIFILDMVTSNDELKYNSKLIVEHFNKSVPLIGYYSMEKEYDEEELLKIAENCDNYLIEKTI